MLIVEIKNYCYVPTNSISSLIYFIKIPIVRRQSDCVNAAFGKSKYIPIVYLYFLSRYFSKHLIDSIDKLGQVLRK